MMRDRLLARSGLRLTELGFGAANLGNLFQAISETTAREAVDAAWGAGIRYFDTAPHYGLGLSERRLGAALATRPRGEYVISTKVGRRLVRADPPRPRDDGMFEVPGDWDRVWDFGADGIRRSLEDSLTRLGLDAVDILYLHDPDVSGLAGAAELGARALVSLRDEGLVRAIGIGTNDAAAAADLLTRADIDVVMLAGRGTLLEPRSADAVLAALGDRALVTAAPFNSGLLARDRPAADATFDYAPVDPGRLARAQLLADAAEATGTTLPAAALASPLRDARVVSVVSGMRDADDVARNAALIAAGVPDETWSEFARRGLLD